MQFINLKIQGFTREVWLTRMLRHYVHACTVLDALKLSYSITQL